MFFCLLGQCSRRQLAHLEQIFPSKRRAKGLPRKATFLWGGGLTKDVWANIFHQKSQQKVMIEKHKSQSNSYDIHASYEWSVDLDKVGGEGERTEEREGGSREGERHRQGSAWAVSSVCFSLFFFCFFWETRNRAKKHFKCTVFLYITSRFLMYNLMYEGSRYARPERI